MSMIALAAMDGLVGAGASVGGAIVLLGDTWRSSRGACTGAMLLLRTSTVIRGRYRGGMGIVPLPLFRG